MNTAPGWYRDPHGDLRWFDGEDWSASTITPAPVRFAAAAATPGPADARRSRLGFPFRTPWATDWVFHWTVLVVVLGAVASMVLNLGAGSSFITGTMIDTAYGVPLVVLLFVLPVAAVRWVAAIVREARRRPQVFTTASRLTVGEPY